MRRRLAEWGRVAPDIQHERVRAARRYEQAREEYERGKGAQGSARPRTERYARRWMGDTARAGGSGGIRKSVCARGKAHDSGGGEARGDGRESRAAERAGEAGIAPKVRARNELDSGGAEVLHIGERGQVVRAGAVDRLIRMDEQ